MLKDLEIAVKSDACIWTDYWISVTIHEPKTKEVQYLISTLKLEGKLSGDDDADYVYISKLLELWKYFQTTSTLEMNT